MDSIDISKKCVDFLGDFRHMVFNPAQAYNELPLLPPKADLETRAILKACIEARVALSELKIARGTHS